MATVTSMSVNGVSNTDREVYVTFKWSKSHTDGFEIDWEYTTGQITKGDYRWYVDDWSTHEPQITQGRYTYRYTAPDNAIGVRCWVRPISTENSKGKKYWTASWSSGKTYYFTRKCPTPKVEGSMSADCKKVTLTGSEYSTDTYTEQFRLWWDRSVDGGEYKKWQDYRINLKSGWEPPTSSTIYDTSVTPGHTYKYRLSTTATKPSSHAFLNKWSDYSEEVELTTFPSKVNNLKAQAASSSSMTLTWDKIANAEEYIVEYTTNKDAWDQNAEGDISSDDGITATKYTVTGLETGQRWYCRVYATNDTGDGEKSDVVSVVVGTVPDAPTLYATETAYMRGEQVYLRWNHNSEDESEQTEAQLRWTDDNGLTWTTITLGSDMYYVLDTTDFDDASTICWQVCTKGVLATYSEWSGAERFMVYAQPSIVPGLFQTDENGNTVDELNNPLIAFPLYISIESESENQNPIAYDVSIKSRDTYLYVNNQGENAWMPAGTVVWSGHLDGELEKKVGFTVSAADAFLVPGVVYEVITSAAMDSGLRSDDSVVCFTCEWSSDMPLPGASIYIDERSLSARVTPYCMEKDENGIETETYQENIILAVWRVDSDGNRTCLGEGIANDGVSAVFDPHPTFGEPKYRIVATDTQTGFIGYEDEISELDINSIVLQWDEEWTQLEADPEEGLYDWSGNLVELPYNIAISEDSNPDVALMEYAGRSHPVSYYGTQLGVTGNWSTDISKESDKQKLDLLRKLAVWTDDVYVREPTGVGYWANVQTSLNQSYDSAAVSVSLSITRVDRTDGITNGN